MLEHSFYIYIYILMLDIQKFLWMPKIQYLKDKKKNISVFKFWPLPAGLGHSIWNMIRRTLLAYTPWVAITALNIKWVSHEYSTIDGVKETVLQIMLNFKDLKFKWEVQNRVEWVSKKFKWIGKYYVEDLDLPPGVEILTSWFYLFEITDPKVELEISYRLEKGYKYLSINDLQKREKELSETNEGVQLWNILIDNDFKVVKNVSYEVDEVISDFDWEYNDYVIINIETISDNVDAKQILTFAWEVISSYTKMFVFDESYIDRDLFVELDDIENNDSKINDTEFKDVRRTPIDSLPTLSERTRNALIKNKIEFVEDLETKTRTELISLKWVGKKAVDEIQEALEKDWKQLWAKK